MGSGKVVGRLYNSCHAKAVVILRRYGGLLSTRLALGFLTVGTVTWTDAITSLRPLKKRSNMVVWFVV